MTMKNIHITPTEHTSRLYYNSQERTYQLCEFPKYHTDIKSTHNLHITSNEEGVYDKDYYLYEGSTFKARPRDEGNFKNKVILTTDQDLIKDGVQAIDDEFLEWFVKNPSCERVETIKVPYFDESGYSYLSIIPKKEHKQETIEEATEWLNKKFNGKGVEIKVIDWNKNETNNYPTSKLLEEYAKWQQERSYSEEDMKKALCDGGNLDYSVLTSTEVGTKILNKWFEQFKKK